MSRSLTNKIIVLIACAALLLLLLSANGLRRGLGGDALGYYMYLPATFIYHNNKSLEKLPHDRKIPLHTIHDAEGMAQNKTPRGYTNNAYTCGVALMEMPFFFTAHSWEKLSGGEANGYSDTYVNFLFVSDLLYALAGLIFVYKILRKYFSETQSLLATITIFFGTNLLWFTVFQEGMSHVPLFFLYSILVYVTICLHEKPRAWLFIIAGFTAGMITLIRPSDIICLLIPFLYNVYNKETLKAKIHFFKSNSGKILLAAAFFMLAVLPQLIYWKIMTGNFIYYSYGDQKFNWGDPKIIEGLFSAHNGWLAYSPVMIFSVFGLILYRNIKPWAWCLWIIFPLYIYIIYSWYCYTYINGFGSRPMINVYPLLAVTLAAFIQLISKQGMILKSMLVTLFLFLVAVSISFSLQQANKMLDSELSNMTYNRNILFKTKLSYNDLVTFDTWETQPDSSKLIKIATLACENYDDSISGSYVKDTTGKSLYVYHMIGEPYGQKGISVSYHKQTFGDAKYFKCSGRFMYPVLGGFTSHYMILSIDSLKWCACKIENKIDILDGSCPAKDVILNHYKNKKWGYVSFYARIPPNIREGKNIAFFIWNPQNCELFIDDVSLEIYKEK